MEELEKKYRYQFWMFLFLLITGGILIYIFWPKISELLKDLKFLRDFLKEKKNEQSLLDEEITKDELLEE